MDALIDVVFGTLLHSEILRSTSLFMFAISIFVSIVAFIVLASGVRVEMESVWI